ncbi:MAG: ankyrin repeat domain-containing protein [Rickettsiaceae bacterium]|nr:ankyrin repeat domain-containing protein [Rickettsiaceae bacterium]
MAKRRMDDLDESDYEGLTSSDNEEEFVPKAKILKKLNKVTKITPVDKFRELVEKLMDKTSSNSKKKSSYTKSSSSADFNDADSALIDAVKNWHATNAKIALTQGANVNITVGEHKDTLLMLAVDTYKNDYHKSSLIKILIDQGIEINTQNSNGDTALIIAAKICCGKAVKELIDGGADHSIVNNDNFLALHVIGQKATNLYSANSKKSYASIKELLLQKAGITLEEYQQELDVVSKKLMSLSKDPLSTLEQNNINNELIKAVTNWQAKNIDQLVHSGADIEVLTDSNKNTLLMLAVEHYVDTQHYRLQLIEKLTSYNIPLDSQNDSGDTALIIAAKKGHWRLIEKLLIAGADFTIENNDQKKAIDLIGTEATTRQGTKSKIKDLFNAADKALKNADSETKINEVDSHKEELEDINLKLINAAKNWEVLNLRNLIAQKADISIQAGPNNNTLLMIAVENYHINRSKSTFLQELIDANIDIDAQNSNGDTALIIAAKKGMLTIVKKLLELNADPNI